MDLKTYLAETGEKQGDFAERVGTTPATISRIITGAFRPALDLAHRIETATGGKVPTETWVRSPEDHPPFLNPTRGTVHRNPARAQA